MVMMLFALILPVNASASASASSSASTSEVRWKKTCWIAADRKEAINLLIRAADRWQCDGPMHIKRDSLWQRYDIASEKLEITAVGDGVASQSVAAQSLPRYLLTRRAAIKAIEFSIAYADGRQENFLTLPNDWENTRLDGFFRAELPPIGKGAQHIYVGFHYPSHVMSLEKAYLSNIGESDDPALDRKLLLLAGLCGMLLMPLIFNFAFYRVLSEPFVLWHSALVVSLLATVMLSSGLVVSLLNLPVMTLSGLSTFVFGMSVGTAAMFTQYFVEPQKMHPKIRAALKWSAAMGMLAAFLHAVFPFVFRPVQSSYYMIFFIPILVIFVSALVDALRRGSRAVKYQAIGWAPMLIVGLIRLVTGLTPSMVLNDAMMLFYFSCVFEVMLTAMGVADRFMSLKDQRDRATTEAEILEMLVERDSLTGLGNRRGIENHFHSLYRQGFRTLAVLDLDYFKTINDIYGHAVGDEVLKTTAKALAPNENLRSFRMGGEEFLLLLRGEDAMSEAENRRQAIERQVMRMEMLINRRVTASMGIIELNSGLSGIVDFHSAFERADKLLYDAKIAGRNCSICEKDDGQGRIISASISAPSPRQDVPIVA